MQLVQTYIAGQAAAAVGGGGMDVDADNDGDVAAIDAVHATSDRCCRCTGEG